MITPSLLRALSFEQPVREKRTPGSARGSWGNRPSYLNAIKP
jgi:hypothetical protein